MGATFLFCTLNNEARTPDCADMRRKKNMALLFTQLLLDVFLILTNRFDISLSVRIGL